MKIVSIAPAVNAVVLVSILLLRAAYHSELGGQETVYGPLSFLLAVLFIFLNFKFNRLLLMAFSFPVLFALVSFIVNAEKMEMGAVHAIWTVAISYLFLTLSPVPLNGLLLRRLVFIYLVGFLLLSLSYCGSQLISGDVAGLVGNKNFNVNPNCAAVCFFGNLLLSLVFIKKWLKWVFVAGFIVLILTTGSRAGFVLTVVVFAGSMFLDKENSHMFNWSFFSIKAHRHILLLIMFLGLLYVAFPAVSFVLKSRISVAGLDLASKNMGSVGRDVIWKTALEESLGSIKTILFGFSPSEVVDRIGNGMHSSYIDVIVFRGWPFFAFLLISIVCLLYYHKKGGQLQFVIFAVSILIYGAFEAMLFNGLHFLWYIFIFLSIYYRSFSPSVLANYEFYPQVRATN